MIGRDQALAALAEHEFDVAVVGGGITGAGVALDAAARGYSVALLERADFASGTSSRSSHWRRTWFGRCRWSCPHSTALTPTGSSASA